MRHLARLLLPALLCLPALPAVAGHHVNGTWKVDVTLGGQLAGTATFVLAEGENGALTGTYTGGAGSAEVAGTVTGSEIEFSFDSQAGKVTYQGAVTGETMSGTCTYGMLGDGTFEGRKQD